MSVGSGSRLHVIWKGIKARCQTRSNSAYATYGGRGITVCAEWQTFVGFLDWALANGYTDDLQVDRVDANGPYSPENCRWATRRINVGRQALDRSGAYLDQLSGRLDDAMVAAAEPRDRSYKMSDGGGLFLWVSAHGSKSWRFSYRFQEMYRLLTIGQYPVVSLTQAREHHAIAKAQLRRGSNPTEVKRASLLRADRRRRAG